MSCLLAEVQSPDCYCTVVNWAACGAAQFIKWISFFCRGGGEGGGISGKSWWECTFRII